MSHPRRRGALLVTLALASLGPACEPSRSGEPEKGVDAGPAAPTHFLSEGWAAGNWYSYVVKMTTRVAFGSGPNVFDLVLDAPLEISVATVDGDAVRLYMALANPRITSRVPGTQGEFDTLAAEIASTGCFADLSDGRVREMLFPRNLSATAANTYRDVASTLQFAHASPASARYSTEEYDTTGRYVADYAFDTGQNEWHKRKERYLEILAAKTVSPQAPGRIIPQVVSSRIDIRLFPDGRPLSIHEQSVVDIKGAQEDIHSTTTVSLESVASEPARTEPPDWVGLALHMVRVAADEPYGGRAPLEALDGARIGHLTFETAVAGLEQIARSGRSAGSGLSAVNGAPLDPSEQAAREKATAEESRLFIGLSAILRQQPETVALAMKKIRAKSPAAMILVHALSSASTPASEAALISLLDEKSLDAETRQRTVLALSRTPRPTAESVRALRAIATADPWNEQALLGLGTYARVLRDADSPEQTESIGALLVERLRKATTTSRRLTILRAITNSGYDGGLEAVLPFLNDPEEMTRTAAVRSLQSMRGERIDPLIADRLQSDPSSSVRISALSAAKVRDPSEILTRAVTGAATEAHDPHVRYRAVEVIATWVQQRDAFRATLERIGRSDPEVRVRDRARAAL